MKLTNKQVKIINSIDVGKPIISLLFPHSNYKRLNNKGREIVHKTEKDYKKDRIETPPPAPKYEE